MTLIEQLKEKFGVNEPILLSEMECSDYSRSWLYKELSKLCENGQLVKYERGIYYIPRITRLGPSTLDPQKVIEKKYIGTTENPVGYYSGLYLRNRVGMTTQVPNIIEICTNNESSKVRDVKIGNQKVRLRKSRVEITRDNVEVLELLELMNSIDVDRMDRRSEERLNAYASSLKIKRKDIKKYSRYYPEKAVRNLVESEVIYNVAQ